MEDKGADFLDVPAEADTVVGRCGLTRCNTY
jgi:hypothetical protein